MFLTIAVLTFDGLLPENSAFLAEYFDLELGRRTIVFKIYDNGALQGLTGNYLAAVKAEKDVPLDFFRFRF